MSAQDNAKDRDEVLFAFHEACSKPTASDIIEWTRKYPQFAEDIRAHAAVARDWAVNSEVCEEPLSDLYLARARSRALNAMFLAENNASGGADMESVQSFHDMAAAINKPVPTLARQLKIKRSVLADLFDGYIEPPIGIRLKDSIVEALSISPSMFDMALRSQLNSPSFGHARSHSPPIVKRRSYREVILASGMTSEEIQFWLSED
jgi:hypothetical protein